MRTSRWGPAVLVALLAGCSPGSSSHALTRATTAATTTTTLLDSTTWAPTATSTAKSNSKSTSPSTAARATPTTSAAVPSTFVGTIASVTAAQLGQSWHPGCPLGPDQLRLLQMSYWGFDNQTHLGTMVVNSAVISDVLQIFGRLFAQHFPIHQMRPVDAYGGSDPASMAADNTSGFNCRYSVPPGNPPQWSVHAFGEAIDVNTVENPYIEGGTIMPTAAAQYVDRSTYRPGMAVPGGQLVQVFASVGWQWGGRWAAPDYQHFSKTGG